MFLREHRHAILDADFQHMLAQSYRQEPGGQEPVDAGLLALATLLQAYCHVGDRDAVALTVMDKRWQLVLDCLRAEQPPFSQGTLFNFGCGSSHTTWTRPCWIAPSPWRRKPEGSVPGNCARSWTPRRWSAPAGVEDTLHLLGHALRQAVGLAAQELGTSTGAAQGGSRADARGNRSLKAALGLREYAGAYQWDRNAFLYLQIWAELAGTNQLVAFDETGELRTLYPTEPDRFFAGPGAAVPASVESRIEFQRDAAGKIASLTWSRTDAAVRTARRVDLERREDVRFFNGDVQLAGTLISPITRGPHPAVILVHASGAEDRAYLLPFARFLIRHGMAVLGFDKRGVGGSTGDWNKASFDDLAGDVVAAFEYLRTRDDIQRARIGMLGWSQAGWVMPLAAARAKDLAFLISISGAGVSGTETTIDQARNEMAANGMPPQMIDQIVELMTLQYRIPANRPELGSVRGGP